MHRDFYGIYQALLTSYDERALYSPFLALTAPLGIAEVVATAAGKAGVSLRPDASFFLVLNFGEMVARPQILTRSVKLEQIRTEIESDLEIILQAAKEATAYSVEKEVSAEVLLHALNESWTKLSASRGWERDES